MKIAKLEEDDDFGAEELIQITDFKRVYHFKNTGK